MTAPHIHLTVDVEVMSGNELCITCAGESDTGSVCIECQTFWCDDCDGADFDADEVTK